MELSERTDVASSAPCVTAIVLNWNRKALLEKCVLSLQNQTYRPLEILIVDNASSDGSVEFVRERFPGIQMIVNPSNLGFSGGNNVGLRHATGDFVAMVNNDTVLDPRCIEELVKTAALDPTVGAVASKILLQEDSTRLDAAGIAICKDGLSIGRGRTERHENYSEEAEVFFASDCLCLYRRAMLDDIGLYDEDFFAYAEETDLGWRARLRGWKSIYNPKAVVLHNHSSTLGAYSPFKVFLVERNRIWVAIKNLPLSYLIAGFLYTIQRYFYQSLGAFLGRGAAGQFVKTKSKSALFWILVKSYSSALYGLPRMLRKRRLIQKSRKISNKDISHLFRMFGLSAREIAFKE